MRNDRDRAAEADMRGDPGLGEAVGGYDERGDEQKPGKPSRLGPVCRASSLFGLRLRLAD